MDIPQRPLLRASIESLYVDRIVTKIPLIGTPSLTSVGGQWRLREEMLDSRLLLPRLAKRESLSRQPTLDVEAVVLVRGRRRHFSAILRQTGIRCPEVGSTSLALARYPPGEKPVAQVVRDALRLIDVDAPAIPNLVQLPEMSIGIPSAKVEGLLQELDL